MNAKKTVTTLTRTQATKLLEEINEAVSEGRLDPFRVARLLADEGIEKLTKCDGLAHQNAHVDNCGVCAPRWGWVGPKLKIT